ncbi:uncharacterized protein [Littorina saxatilis]|uniref:G-protein coupled receptors family 1 profile domain-containing protein n=1 Tax=Littorina saxatilis TaxID=31220 RepID=A0AAN9AR56_9CAEN
MKADNLTDQATIGPEEFLHLQNHHFASVFAPTLTYIIVLMVAGVVGNIIVFLVYFRRYKPSSSRTFVLSMSVCDLLTNVLSLPTEFLFRFRNDLEVNDAICRANGAAKSFLVLFSGFLLVTVALDRYMKVCRPTKRQYTLKKTLALCSVVAFSTAVPTIVLVGKQTIRFEGSNITGSTCFIDEDFVHSLYLDVYKALVVVTFVSSVAVMGTAYGLIARRLWKHKKRMAAPSRGIEDSETQETRFTENESRCQTTTETKAETTCGKASTQNDRTIEPFKDQLESESQSAASSVNEQNQLAESGDPKATLSTSTDKTVKTSTIMNNDGLQESGIQTEQVSTVRVSTIASSKTSVKVSTVEDFSTSDENAAEPKLEATLGITADHRATVCTKASGLSALCCWKRRNVNPPLKNTNSLLPTSHRARAVRKIPKRTTLMMFVLTAVFVVNFLPYLVTLSWYGGEDRLDLDRWGLNVYHISVRSYFFNSAVNPLVYSFYSARFRHECRGLFSCKIR